MNTKELAKKCGVHTNTILRLFDGGNGVIKGNYIGGRRGHDFPETAVQQVFNALTLRHQRRVAAARKARRSFNGVKEVAS